MSTIKMGSRWCKFIQIGIFSLMTWGLLEKPCHAYESEEGILVAFLMSLFIFIIFPLIAMFYAIRLPLAKNNRFIAILLPTGSISLILLSFFATTITVDWIKISALPTAFIGAIIGIMALLTRRDD